MLLLLLSSSCKGYSLIYFVAVVDVRVLFSRFSNLIKFSFRFSISDQIRMGIFQWNNTTTSTSITRDTERENVSLKMSIDNIEEVVEGQEKSPEQLNCFYTCR